MPPSTPDSSIRPAKRLQKVRQWFRQNSPTAYLLKNSTQSYLIIMLGAVISMAYRIGLARLLGVEAYGEYAYAYTWLTSPLLVVTVLGYDVASLRFIADYVANERWQLLRSYLGHVNRRTWTLSVVVALTVLLVSVALSPFMTTTLLGTFVITAALTLVNGRFFLISRSILALKRVMMAQLPYFLLRPLLALLAILMAYLVLDVPRNAMTAMGLFAAITVGLFLISSRYFNQHIPPQAWHNAPVNSDTAVSALQEEPQEEPQEKPQEEPQEEPDEDERQWRSAAFQLLLMNGFRTAITRMDVILIGVLLSTSAAGIYATAAALVTLIGFGLVAVNSVIAPMLSELYSQNKMKALQRLATNVAYLIFGYTVLTTFGVVLFGETLLSLFGEEFTLAYGVLIVLMFSKIVNSLTGSVGYMLTMTGNQRAALRIVAMSSVINLLLNLILIPAYGMIGAALAGVLATMLWNGLMYLEVKRQTGIDTTIFSALLTRPLSR